MSDFLGDLVPGREPRPRRPAAPAQDGDHLPVVPCLLVACPDCGEQKPTTDGRNGRRRYHRCRSCGRKFLSHELRDLAELEAWLRQARR